MVFLINFHTSMVKPSYSPKSSFNFCKIISGDVRLQRRIAGFNPMNLDRWNIGPAACAERTCSNANTRSSALSPVNTYSLTTKLLLSIYLWGLIINSDWSNEIGISMYNFGLIFKIICKGLQESTLYILFYCLLQF